MKNLLTNQSNSTTINQSNTNTNVTTKLSFEEFYNSGVSLKKLREGKYSARLKEHKFVKPTVEGGNPYVSMDFVITDLVDGSTRPLHENKFEQGFSIMLSQVKTQLNKEDENIPVPAILAHMLNNDVDIWVEYAQDPLEPNKTYRNIHFLEPVAKTSAQSTTVSLSSFK